MQYCHVVERSYILKNLADSASSQPKAMLISFVYHSVIIRCTKYNGQSWWLLRFPSQPPISFSFVCFFFEVVAPLKRDSTSDLIYVHTQQLIAFFALNRKKINTSLPNKFFIYLAAIRFAQFFSFGFRTRPRTFYGASVRFAKRGQKFLLVFIVGRCRASLQRLLVDYGQTG